MTEEKYLVIWHLCKKVPKEGFFSRLTGETSEKLQPVIHSFSTREVAENAFFNIKKIGGKPSLLKVIK